VNAAVQPVLDRYMRGCRTSCRRAFARDLLVMNGNGGTVPARWWRARRRRR
jgi:N-methylhydantoinase A